MVSFTSLITLSLLAVTQVVQGVPAGKYADPLLPVCQVAHDLTTGNTHNTVDFKVQDDTTPTQLVPITRQASWTTIQIEKSKFTGKWFTTIYPGDGRSGQNMLRIWWTTKDGSEESQFFYLKQNQKCRVANSNQYYDLKAATYLEMNTTN